MISLNRYERRLSGNIRLKKGKLFYDEKRFHQLENKIQSTRNFRHRQFLIEKQRFTKARITDYIVEIRILSFLKQSSIDRRLKRLEKKRQKSEMERDI